MSTNIKPSEIQNIVSNTSDTNNSASIIDSDVTKDSTLYIRGIVSGEGIVVKLIDTPYPDGLAYSTGKTIEISSSQSSPVQQYEKIKAYSDLIGTPDNYYMLPDDYQTFIFLGNGTNYVTIPSGKPNGYKIDIRNATGQTFSGATYINIIKGNIYSPYGALLKSINPINPAQAFTIICDGNDNWYQYL